MSIVKLSDGRLLVHDSVPVDDATLAEIKAWGTPAIQVVTHNQHCIDARAFKEKLGLKTYCPRACEAAVRERVSVDGTFEDLPADPALDVRPTGGLKNGETWFVVKTNGRSSLLTADTVTWVQTGQFFLKLMGFISAEPKVAPTIFKLVALKDKKAFRASFEKLLADYPSLTRVVPCHGAVIDKDVVATLRRGIERSL
jgi:glyoxylase-like metal-dependent hydrolase (beta-lactamase superfamily II)